VHRVGRRGLVAAVVCVAALCAAAAAAAQVQPPAGPSLRVQTALLRQVDDDLRFELRLSRAVRVSAIEPGKRFACLVLGPSVPARRRVCVVRRGARLHAGGRFRQHVSFRDRTVDARQADGIHLSVAGASIAATLLIDRLRADRALPPG